MAHHRWRRRACALLLLAFIAHLTTAEDGPREDIARRLGSTTASESSCTDAAPDCNEFAVLCGQDAWVDSNCKKSCGKCPNGGGEQNKPTAASASTTPGTSKSSCKDARSDCKEFHVLCGEDAWVDSNCAKTCGKCPSGGKRGTNDEATVKQKAKEEAAKRKKAEDEAAAKKKKAEDEAAAKKKAEEERTQQEKTVKEHSKKERAKKHEMSNNFMALSMSNKKKTAKAKERHDKQVGKEKKVKADEQRSKALSKQKKESNKNQAKASESAAKERADKKRMGKGSCSSAVVVQPQRQLAEMYKKCGSGVTVETTHERDPEVREAMNAKKEPLKLARCAPGWKLTKRALYKVRSKGLGHGAGLVVSSCECRCCTGNKASCNCKDQKKKKKKTYLPFTSEFQARTTGKPVVSKASEIMRCAYVSVYLKSKKTSANEVVKQGLCINKKAMTKKNQKPAVIDSPVVNKATPSGRPAVESLVEVDAQAKFIWGRKRGGFYSRIFSRKNRGGRGKRKKRGPTSLQGFYRHVRKQAVKAKQAAATSRQKEKAAKKPEREAKAKCNNNMKCRPSELRRQRAQANSKRVRDSVVWKRENSEWKLKVDCANFNKYSAGGLHQHRSVRQQCSKMWTKAKISEFEASEQQRESAANKVFFNEVKRDKGTWTSPADHEDALAEGATIRTAGGKKYIRQMLEDKLQEMFHRELQFPAPRSFKGSPLMATTKCADQSYYKVPDGAKKVAKRQCPDFLQGKRNCCLASCGGMEKYPYSKEAYGTRPFLWDSEAVDPPPWTERASGRIADESIVQKLTMCKKPSTMAPDEHILRVHVCGIESMPFCVRLKVTRRKSRGSSDKLVLGWARIAAPAKALQKDLQLWVYRARKKLHGSELEEFCETCLRKRASDPSACKLNKDSEIMCGKVRGAIMMARNADGTIRDAIADLRFDISSAALA